MGKIPQKAQERVVLNSRLIEAYGVDATEEVYDLLKKGADANTHFPDGRTLLMLASLSGNEKMVNELLKYGADINARFRGSTALHYAHHRGVVRELLKHGADFSIKDGKGRTALNCTNDEEIKDLLKEAKAKKGLNSRLRAAAQRGKLEIVRELLHEGANINATDPKGNTPLMLATLNGHVAVARDLLENDADVNANVKGDFMISTALMNAANIGDVGLVYELLQRGANVDPGGFSTTALMNASAKGDMGVVKILIEHNADVNAEDVWGDTPLKTAAHYYNKDIVCELLACGADVNMKSELNGTSALIETAQSGNLEIVRCLIDAGADVNAANSDGHTALMYASQWGHIDVVDELLSRGADVDAQTVDGSTALSFAKIDENPKIIRLLKAAKLKKKGSQLLSNQQNGLNDKLIKAAHRGNVDAVRVLLYKGADANSEDSDGYTAIIKAAQKGHSDIVRVLLDEGADVNTENIIGWTALMYAAEKGYLDIVSGLLDNGANVNAKNSEGMTALMYAAINDQDWIAQDLINRGADISAESKEGFSALRYARRHGHKMTAEILQVAQEG